MQTIGTQFLKSTPLRFMLGSGYSVVDTA
jgi:hypothetical protein